MKMIFKYQKPLETGILFYMYMTNNKVQS